MQLEYNWPNAKLSIHLSFSIRKASKYDFLIFLDVCHRNHCNFDWQTFNRNTLKVKSKVDIRIKSSLLVVFTPQNPCQIPNHRNLAKFKRVSTAGINSWASFIDNWFLVPTFACILNWYNQKQMLKMTCLPLILSWG